MTVIAFDGRTVAADKQSTMGCSHNAVTKLYRHGNKVLAVCGRADHGMAMVAWYQSGANPEKFPRSVKADSSGDDRAWLIVFEPGKRVLQYEEMPVPVVFEDVPVAMGCGKAEAMGAMLAGADARRAVEIASQLNIHCGNGVDVMELCDAGDLGGTVAPAGGPAAAGSRPALVG